MKKFIVTIDDLIKYMGEENYWKFNKTMRRKHKLKKNECFGLLEKSTNQECTHNESISIRRFAYQYK